MAFEVVPTAAGRLHSDQYTKIIIINTPINLRVFPCFQTALKIHILFYRAYATSYRYSEMPMPMHADNATVHVYTTSSNASPRARALLPRICAVWRICGRV